MIPPVELTLKDIDASRGLPSRAYTDAELFMFERDQIMAKTWVGIAFESDLPSDGYAFPVDFMGLPLVVIRDAEGTARVFHNVCSHRGMPLVREAGPVGKTIHCAYHRWGYGVDGALRSTPNIGGTGIHTVEGFDCAQHGLKEVRSATFLGVTFVNLSGEADSFDNFIAPVKDRWESYAGQGAFNDLRIAETGSELTLHVASNWKLPVENYCEAYHLPWVHPDLNSYSPLDKHDSLIVSEGVSGQVSYAYSLSQVAETSLPIFSGWSSEKTQYAEYLSIYPNVLVGIQADHVFSIVLMPDAVNATRERLKLLYVGDEATTDEYAACRESVLQAWDVVFKEDIFAVEGMQQGRASPGFDGGVFSPVMDVSTHHFHQWIARQYQL